MVFRLESWRDAASVGRFVWLHVSAMRVLLVPFEWTLVWWLGGSYVMHMFGVTDTARRRSSNGISVTGICC